MDNVEKEIYKIREEIDEIDFRIIKLLKIRMQYALEIAHIKKENDMKITDSKREKQLIKSRKVKAKNNELREKFAKKLFQIILNESKKIQKKGKTNF